MKKFIMNLLKKLILINLWLILTNEESVLRGGFPSDAINEPMTKAKIELLFKERKPSLNERAFFI
ncbi:hypothetical protein RBIBE_16920 [Bacillus velezensis]|nr:hypothetical protein RBIBE_16920 [Bacillus velezensis]